MAKRRLSGRSLNGILLLDKPIGRTSNHVLQEVKHLFKARKAGHTGSLDPLATGLLPICFGEATKMSAFLLDADKLYQLKAKLGQTTDTGDADGKVIETHDCEKISLSKIDHSAAGFHGEIKQTPPMYSAIKHKGQPLYKLARQGIEIEREARPVTIHEIRVLSKEENQAELQVHCSKGTYIRTLVEDIGKDLGCGAHVSELRRLAVAPFYSPQMYTLGQLQAYAAEGEDLKALDAVLLSSDAALGDKPELQVSADMLYYLRMGQAVQIPRSPSSGLVRLYDRNDDFVGMGRVQEDGKIAPKRLFVR